MAFAGAIGGRQIRAIGDDINSDFGVGYAAGERMSGWAKQKVGRVHVQRSEQITAAKMGMIMET
jgi:hypothetical protein